MKHVGIYLHVPFCRGKCPYCDFYSVSVSDEMLDAYTAETIRRIRQWKDRRIVADTVYFGGGTPSLLGGERIGRLLTALDECVFLARDAEITVEANPSAELSEFLRVTAAAGVKRLSLGMQSAVARELAAIGRRHTPDDVLRNMEAAHAARIDNISLDLMLGIPHQTPETLSQSLRFIGQCGPAHVSAYLLKIEEGTPFYRRRDSLPIADGDGQADLYLQAFDALDGMGFEQYEISNAARGGLVGRHNVNYWDDGEYLALGPAAHGFFDGRRYFFPRSLSDYLSGTEPTFDCFGGSEEEYVMLRLRLADGLTERGLLERFGHGIPAAMRKKAENPRYAPFFSCDDTHIALTRQGMLLSNYLISELLS